VQINEEQVWLVPLKQGARLFDAGGQPNLVTVTMEIIHQRLCSGFIRLKEQNPSCHSQRSPRVNRSGYQPA
jgi:hypothetical protein